MIKGENGEGTSKETFYSNPAPQIKLPSKVDQLKLEVKFY